MAFIDDSSAFDADSIKASVVGIAAELGQHDSGIHQHRKGQLLYAPQGCITLTLDNALCILPPTKAVWIPPHVPHRAQMTNVVAYRSLYFDTDVFKCPEEITTIKVNDLLKALINKIALWEWDITEHKTLNTSLLFWEEFHSLTHQTLMLPLPNRPTIGAFLRTSQPSRFYRPPVECIGIIRRSEQ